MSIGSAIMLESGLIVLHLRAESMDGLEIGDAEIAYAPDAPGYKMVLAHIPGLTRGGEPVPVPPWPDRIEKDWDESKHPRDPAGTSTGGQFAGGGGGDSNAAKGKDKPPTRTPAEAKEHETAVLREAKDVARGLGIDPDIISIGEAGKSGFKIDGKAVSPAGITTSVRGISKIKLFPDEIKTVKQAGTITAHEAQHVKFADAMYQYEIEKKEIEKDADAKAAMKEDGTLPAPYDKTYGAYNAMQTAIFRHGPDKFGMADGVSPYSRMYWEGVLKDKVDLMTAMHETFAEMAAAKFETGKLPEHEAPDEDESENLWREAYTVIDKVYRGDYRQ